VQHKSDKARAFKGVQGTDGGVDLMIVDIPEGLPVPMVSSPPTSIPGWNSADPNFLPLVFDFGSSLTHDNGTLLLFHKDDLKFKADIRGFANAYHFKIMKEWTGINRFATHEYQGCIQDCEWFQPFHMLHSCKHKHLRFLYCSSLTMLYSSVDIEVLHSTAGEELSGGAFIHILH
jgi:hypothetical protein